MSMGSGPGQPYQGGVGNALGMALQRFGGQGGGKSAGPGAPYGGGQPQQASQGMGSAVGNALRGSGIAPGQQQAFQQGAAQGLGGQLANQQNSIGSPFQQQSLGQGAGQSRPFSPPPPPGGWAPGTPGQGGQGGLGSNLAGAYGSPQGPPHMGSGGQLTLRNGASAKGGGPGAPYGGGGGWTPPGGGFHQPSEMVQGPDNPVMQARQGNANAQALNQQNKQNYLSQFDGLKLPGFSGQQTQQMMGSNPQGMNAGHAYGYAGPVGYGNNGPSGVQPYGQTYQPQTHPQIPLMPGGMNYTPGQTS